MNDEKYNRSLEYLRRRTRDEGIDRALKVNDIDVIIGPADSHLASTAAGSGEHDKAPFNDLALTICRIPNSYYAVVIREI